jgi:hypothetical protein
VGDNLEVARDDLHRTRTVEDQPALDADQVRLSVDAFGLSSNNITYAVFGDAMKYWDFWPAEEGWGRVPVWGYATVLESRHGGVPEGTELYGYLPMSSEAVLTVAKADEHGISEGSSYRLPLPSPYNRYSLVAGDPGHEPEHRPQQMVLRPLYATGWMMADQITDEDGYGAEQVLLSSASSKTAISTAFSLRGGGARLVGLTSTGNVDFVEGTGIYDEVVTYDAVGDVAGDTAVFVDMAGNGDLRRAVHDRFGDGLKHSAVVGATHWNAEGGPDMGGGELPGPRPTFFFAPDRIAKRSKDWGPGRFDERLDSSWDEFVREGTGWMRIEEVHGAEQVEATYQQLLDGSADPALGFVCDL